MEHRTPARPAFYALAPGGWRDYVTLLHLPYTLWHLSYVVIGGCLAANPDGGRLALTVLAFFLGLGIAAHALDELNGRPLQTRISAGIETRISFSTKPPGGRSLIAKLRSEYRPRRSERIL